MSSSICSEISESHSNKNPIDNVLFSKSRRKSRKPLKSCVRHIESQSPSPPLSSDAPHTAPLSPPLSDVQSSLSSLSPCSSLYSSEDSALKSNGRQTHKNFESEISDTEKQKGYKSVLPKLLPIFLSSTSEENGSVTNSSDEFDDKYVNKVPPPPYSCKTNSANSNTAQAEEVRPPPPPYSSHFKGAAEDSDQNVAGLISNHILRDNSETNLPSDNLLHKKSTKRPVEASDDCLDKKVWQWSNFIPSSLSLSPVPSDESSDKMTTNRGATDLPFEFSDNVLINDGAQKSTAESVALILDRIRNASNYQNDESSLHSEVMILS